MKPVLLVLMLAAPAVQEREAPYRSMDYGPSLSWTYQVADKHIVYKGTAVRVDEGPGGIARGKAWVVFDQDTLSLAAGWIATPADRAPFINWKGVAFDGSHNSHPRIAGREVFVNPPGPGFGHPKDGRFEDQRFESPVDHKRYGPIPMDWGHFKGLYHHGSKVVFSYTIGETAILETPGLEGAIFTRTFRVGPSSSNLRLRAAPEEVSVKVVGPGGKREGALIVLPASKEVRVFKLLIGPGAAEAESPAPADPSTLIRGGPAAWPGEIETPIVAQESAGGFECDELKVPGVEARSWMRPGGFDFFADGKRAAVCTWNGDVWLVSGIDRPRGEKLSWRRILTGLFQPLGLRIVGGQIFVSCRDQVARLHDLDGDGGIDFVESFNNDHQVTEHFHEFAMGLQTDKDGNFYYAKSARHALPALVPHHGTLIRVSKDGSASEIVASGFRAANGVCVNDDGTFYVTDQEGHWTPKNRINRVKPGGFYGNMMGWVPPGQSPADDAMEQPLVWITNALDRSPAELLWVRSPSWGALDGKLLLTSYGTGRVFLVLPETVGGAMQGGLTALPFQFPTGIMRGRFHPGGDLYVCGLFGWSSDRTGHGGFYRVRRTGPLQLPVSLRSTPEGPVLGFSCALDAKSAADPENYGVRAWDLKRSGNYGSKHEKERALEVQSAELLEGGTSVRLKVAGWGPTRGLSIRIRVQAADGAALKQDIHATVHRAGGEGK